MGRQHQGMDRPGVRQIPEGSGEQGKMEKTDCKIICGAPTTLAVKEFMMTVMMSCYVELRVNVTSPRQIPVHILMSLANKLPCILVPLKKDQSQASLAIV